MEYQSFKNNINQWELEPLKECLQHPELTQKENVCIYYEHTPTLYRICSIIVCVLALVCAVTLGGVLMSMAN